MALGRTIDKAALVRKMRGAADRGAPELTGPEKLALERLTDSGGLDGRTALEMIVSSRAVPDGVEAQTSRPIPSDLPAPGLALTDEEVREAMQIEAESGRPFWRARMIVLASRSDIPRRFLDYVPPNVPAERCDVA